MADPIQGDLFADAGNPPERTVESAAPQRVFVDWNRPLLKHAVAHLASNWSGGILDLSSHLVVVPTRHAGRRLREALALHTAGSGAVIPPLVVPPDFLVSADRIQDIGSVASTAEALLAWIDTLRSLKTHQFRDLFPVDPVEHSFTWALHTASNLIELRRSLAETGFLIADAAEKLATSGIETKRWHQLAALEESALEKIAICGLLDPETSRIRAARAGTPPPGIERIHVLGVADPLPLALEALARYSAMLPTEVLIYAPADHADAFDPWGRPLANAWGERSIDIPKSDTTLHPAATPEAQAAKVLELLASYDNEQAPRTVAVCLPDATVTAPLRKAFESRALGTFDPGGQALKLHEIYYLLSTFAQLFQSRSMTAFAELIRCPDLAKALHASLDEGNASSIDRTLKAFDRLQAEHLPESIDDAASLIGSSKSAPAEILKQILRWLDEFDSGNLDDVLPRFLGFAYSQRRFRADQPECRRYHDVARLLEQHLETTTHAAADALENSEHIELLLHLLQSGSIYPERESSDIDLQGWLELLWEDAPHVVLTGFNDGQVPEAVVGDPYLPNTALAALGLRDNNHWLARDAYYLTAILESRREHGRSDIVFGCLASDATPLRPSRLLFRCPDENLPSRALQLFHGTADNENSREAPAAWTRSWQLKPPALPDPDAFAESLGVTAFRTYLACPTRFYLSHGFGMDSVEIDKMEMNAMDFGNLCHEVLNRFGRDGSMRDSDNASAIVEFLTREAENLVCDRYGKAHSVPVMIQLESAKQRLAWAAEKQAELRREGWKIETAEWIMHEPEPWKIGGTAIHGIIDRIDRHEETGALRIIDYKTTFKPVTPLDAHLSTFGRIEDPEAWPDWAMTNDAEGTLCAWSDLQLPLYLHAARARYPDATDAKFSCAYFNLPRAVAETDLLPWDNLDEKLLEAALRCAEGVITSIGNREFWPPSESIPFDDFETLFFGEAAQAIDEKYFLETIEQPTP